MRELRNYGGQVLDRVEAGETVIITRDGRPVARLAPLPTSRLNAQALLEKWKNVPVIDGDLLRSDLEQILDLEL